MDETQEFEVFGRTVFMTLRAGWKPALRCPPWPLAYEGGEAFGCVVCRRKNCVRMIKYGRMPGNLNGLITADGSGLARRVPRPLKERAGALWPPRNLRTDEHVWRNAGKV
jgi:hypothetical protein